MPSFDDILKSAGLAHRVHDDERLGRFVGVSGPWRLSTTVDFPFQADVPIVFTLDHDTLQFPESIPKNVIWIQDNLGEIWNGAAAAVNAMLETEAIPMPETFAISHLWFFIPDAPMEHAEWKLLIEPEDTSISIEVIFNGINVTRHSHDAT